MSNPISAPSGWWADLSPQQFRMIVQTVVATPGIDDIFEKGDLGRARGGRIPATIKEMLKEKEGLRFAYLNAFRAYLEAHGEAAEEAIAQWAQLTAGHLDPSTVDGLTDLFQDFRRDLKTVVTKIGESVGKESVTGPRKQGRVVLRHQGVNPLVRAGGKKMYRTREGYLVHKTGILPNVHRNSEDWRIMLDRATRHVQSEMTTKALVESLREEFGTDGGSRRRLWQLITDLRDRMLRLRMEAWEDGLRESVASAYSAWSEAARKTGKFGEVPSYAAGRILATQDLLRRETIGLVDFCTKVYPKHDKDDDRETLEELVEQASTAMQGFLNAYQGVYDAVVDCCDRFYKWLCDWTEQQKEKGFRTEHLAAWLCIEATDVLMQATILGAKITMNVLSAGTASVILAPVFMGAGPARKKLADKLKELIIDEDIKELDREAKASEYLGKEYRTAQERALGRVAGIYHKVTEGAEKLDEANEWRERAEGGLVVLEAVGKLLEAEENEEAEHAMKLLEHIVNPVSMAGEGADVGFMGAVGGLKLALTVAGDVITLVVPPKLVKTVKAPGVEALQRALTRALAEMDEQSRKALVGELRRNRAREAVISKPGGTFEVTFTTSDGTAWTADLEIDPESGRPVWQDCDKFLMILDRAENSIKGWLPWDGVDLKAHLYARHKSSKVTGDAYQPESHRHQAAIVRFDLDDVFDHKASRKAVEQGRYEFNGITGQPLTRANHRWGAKDTYTLTLTAEGNVYYEGPTRPPAKAKGKRKKVAAKTVLTLSSEILEKKKT